MTYVIVCVGYSLDKRNIVKLIFFSENTMQFFYCKKIKSELEHYYLQNAGSWLWNNNISIQEKKWHD